MSDDLGRPAPTPVPDIVRRFDRTTERWAAQLRRRPSVDRLAYALSEEVSEPGPLAQRLGLDPAPFVTLAEDLRAWSHLLVLRRA